MQIITYILKEVYGFYIICKIFVIIYPWDESVIKDMQLNALGSDRVSLMPFFDLEFLKELESLHLISITFR